MAERKLTVRVSNARTGAVKGETVHIHESTAPWRIIHARVSPHYSDDQRYEFGKVLADAYPDATVVMTYDEDDRIEILEVTDG